MGRFEELQGIWNKANRPSKAVQGMPDSMKKVITANQLLDQLLAVATATHDMRFVAAAEALRDHGLLDERGNWRRNIPATPMKSKRTSEALALQVISLHLQNNSSLRLACAETAASLGWKGPSFDAAVKSLERLWAARPGPGELEEELNESLRQNAAGRRRHKRVAVAFFGADPEDQELLEQIEKLERAEKESSAAYRKLVQTINARTAAQR